MALIPAKAVSEIFKNVVEPPGFDLVKSCVLANKISADITHLMILTAYKGGMYGLRWGVSLNYVPHHWENELRWHRTLKSARFDLWDHILDLPESFNLTKLPPNSSIPNVLRGEELFEQNLRREWKDLQSTISSWLNRVRDLSGALAMSAEQMRRNWKGPSHWPPPSLVHAFTLARMGLGKEAKLELNAIINQEVSDPKGLLKSALDKVSAETHSLKEVTDGSPCGVK